MSEIERSRVLYQYEVSVRTSFEWLAKLMSHPAFPGVAEYTFVDLSRAYIPSIKKSNKSALSMDKYPNNHTMRAVTRAGG